MYHFQLVHWPWMRQVSGQNADQEQEHTCHANLESMLFDFMHWLEQKMLTCQALLTIDLEILVVKVDLHHFAACFKT
jgi:hypothetical protein